jgi:putative colanic acid biosynthesis acetyltransferase WcaF
VPDVPVIDLSRAPGARESWDAPVWKVLLWAVAELLLVSNHWQISSRLRRATLVAFGARIGRGVLLRPGLRVRFPWKLSIGDRSWIGEDVWLHNQESMTIGSDAVLSQGTFITTGSHDHRRDMALIAKPVIVADGAWVTARCVVLGGSRVGVSALVTRAPSSPGTSRTAWCSASRAGPCSGRASHEGMTAGGVCGRVAPSGGPTADGSGTTWT